MWVGAAMDGCQKLKVMCGGSSEKQKSLKFGGKRNTRTEAYWRTKCEAVVCERDSRAGQIGRERLSGMKGMLDIFQGAESNTPRESKREIVVREFALTSLCCCMDTICRAYCTCALFRFQEVSCCVVEEQTFTVCLD